MRGKNILFNDNIDTSYIKNEIGKGGRNKVLIQKRNEALIHRYYYYKTFTKYRYEYIIERLHLEFYLSANQVVKIITNNFEIYRIIKHKGYSINDLKALYISFNWSLKDV